MARRIAVASVLTLVSVFGSPGCSYQLDSVRSNIGNEVERTAAIASEPAGLVSEGDFVVARAAVSEVLGKGGKTTSVPWENPRTGAHGTITPLASANTEHGLICHNFLASYVRDGNASWLQGEACRAKPGRWEVRTLKPLRKSEDSDRRSDFRDRKK
jgi:surface antigen